MLLETYLRLTETSREIRLPFVWCMIGRVVRLKIQIELSEEGRFEAGLKLMKNTRTTKEQVRLRETMETPLFRLTS